MPNPPTSGPMALVGFGLFFMLIVAGFNAYMGYGVYQQIRAESWPSAPGMVMSSGVDSHTDADGDTTNTARVRYDYIVNNQRLHGDRYQFALLATTGNHAEQIAEQFPQGHHVWVRYDPNNPAVSVLSAGIDSSRWFTLLFLVPFNAAGLWMLGVGASNVNAATRPRGGLKIALADHMMRLRVNYRSPVLHGLAGLGLGAFVAVVGGYALAGGFGVSQAVLQAGVALTLGGGIIGAGLAIGKNLDPDNDVIIDHHSGIVRLPARGDRRQEAIDVRLVDIEGVAVDEYLDESKVSINNRPVPCCSPVLVAKGAQGAHHRFRLVNWLDTQRAERLADWLRAELRLPEEAGETTDAREAPPQPVSPPHTTPFAGLSAVASNGRNRHPDRELGDPDHPCRTVWTEASGSPWPHENQCKNRDQAA